MGSRFVPVKSEEELRRYNEAGLLYFNCSMTIPRGQDWVRETDAWHKVLSEYRLSQELMEGRDWDATDMLTEDWGYLVEDDSPNEDDSPTNSE